MEDSTAYTASVALHPEMKFHYFEEEWHEHPDWIEKAKEATIRMWRSEYRLPTSSSAESFQTIIPHPGASSTASLPDVHLPSWRRKKRARLASNGIDAFERFQKREDEAIDIGHNVMLPYWIKQHADPDPHVRALALMGIELASIPAMSSEPERVFSRYLI